MLSLVIYNFRGVTNRKLFKDETLNFNMKIKKIGSLEGELVRHYSLDSSPVLVLDTGGLIDIVTSIRQYELLNRSEKKDPRYMDSNVFLGNLSKAFRMVITPKTYQEIERHGRTRLNQHTSELVPSVVDFSFETMLNSDRFISGVESNISLDDARYDAYWAAQYGCKGNHKKCLEGCSDTDREILSAAAYLSTVQDIDPVLVVSSDLHVLGGSKCLVDNFDDRYSRIVPIPTRK